MAFYRPTYYKAQEWVPRSIFEAFGPARSFQFLDDRILITGDRLRKRYGPILLNTWHLGGPRDSCGFRRPDDPEGAPLSMHKLGKAGDFHFGDVSLEEVREELRAHPELEVFEFVTRVEMNTPSWLHLDVANVARVAWIPYLETKGPGAILGG